MKKLLTYGVVMATIVWSLGLSAVVPLATAAYTPTAGDLVKTATNSAVYYIDADGKRHLFVNAVTFWTWYSGDRTRWTGIKFGNTAKTITVISQTDFDALTLGSHVAVRPGVNLVKFQNSPKSYAVLPNAVLSYVSTEAAASALYGADWAKKIITIQDGFENDYAKTGADLTATSKLPDGSLVKWSWSKDIYYISDGKKRKVSTDGFVANGFKYTSVLTASASMTYEAGTGITAKEAALSTVAGTGSGGSVGNGGMHFGVDGGVTSFSNEIKGAGIEITREWIEWNRIEPTNNNYNWTDMDAKVRAANNAGVEILGYPVGTPNWAKKNSGCTADICTINNMSEFREFMKRVAERYNGGSNGEMKYIEILNEVTQPVFFEKNNDNKYEEWLVAGYEGVKEGNSNAQVLVGGFINPTHAESFVRNMLQNYDNYYDIVNFHVYETEDQNTIATQAIKGWMDEYNVDKPMWITETATLIMSGESDALNNIAKAVIKRYIRSFGEGVETVFWFATIGTPVPEDGVSGAARNKIVGLGWSVKGSTEFHPRPAYTAYKTMATKLAGFSSVTKITDTQYKFIFSNKSPVYVLWCASGTCSLPSEISGSVKVTDYLGNEEIKNANQISLTNSPIFIE